MIRYLILIMTTLSQPKLNFNIRTTEPLLTLSELLTQIFTRISLNLTPKESRIFNANLF